MQLARARAQVIVEFLGRPWSGRRIGGRQRRRDPVVDFGPSISAAGLLRSQKVPWRMAGAAVAQALREIGAAIPLRTLRDVRLEAARAEKQQLPTRLEIANVKG